MPKIIESSQTGKIVLFLYPTPKFRMLPSTLYNNVGRIICINPYKNKNSIIDTNMVLLCANCLNMLSLYYYIATLHFHIFTFFDNKKCKNNNNENNNNNNNNNNNLIINYHLGLVLPHKDHRYSILLQLQSCHFQHHQCHPLFLDHLNNHPCIVASFAQ